MADTLVITETQNRIGTIRLNDPEKLNAFSQPMVRALTAALEDMWYDEAVRAILVRGSGGNFSAGGNIIDMKNRVDCYCQGIAPPTSPQRNLRNLNRLTMTVRRIEKPVIALLEGSVAGGGLSLAMACDFSYADEACKFVFAFSNIGLAPDMGSSLLLTRRVGIPRATQLLMTGSRFSGRQAADWGIITEAAPSEILEEKAMALAQKLAAGPARSYAAVKAILNQTMYLGLDDIMVTEAEVQSVLSRSEDHAEAVNAFLEKRTAIFQGK